MSAVTALPVVALPASAECFNPVEALGLDDWPSVMSPKVLGEHLDVSTDTLARWRKTWPSGDRQGPAFSEPVGGNMVRYARLDVAFWLWDSRIEGEKGHER